MLSPFPWTRHQFVLAMIENAADLVLVLPKRFGNRFPMQTDQFRLVVDQIEGGRAAILKEKDHLLRPGCDMRQSLFERIEWINAGRMQRFRPGLFRHQGCQRDSGKTTARSFQKLAARLLEKVHGAFINRYK